MKSRRRTELLERLITLFIPAMVILDPLSSSHLRSVARKKFYAKKASWQSGFPQNPLLGSSSRMKDGQREENGLQLEWRCSRVLIWLKAMVFCLYLTFTESEGL